MTVEQKDIHSGTPGLRAGKVQFDPPVQRAKRFKVRARNAGILFYGARTIKRPRWKEAPNTRGERLALRMETKLHPTNEQPAPSQPQQPQNREFEGKHPRGYAGKFAKKGTSKPPPKKQPAKKGAPTKKAPSMAGKKIKVVKGDTLWALAEKYLGDGNRWKELGKQVGITTDRQARRLQIGTEITIPGKAVSASKKATPAKKRGTKKAVKKKGTKTVSYTTEQAREAQDRLEQRAQMALSTKGLELPFETKGVVRHVKTQAGVKRFGQPIGTVIVRDSPLKKLRGVAQEVEGWNRYEGADKKFYHVIKDPDNSKQWVVLDSRDRVIHEAGSEADALKTLNDSIKAPPHFSFTETRKMTDTERAAHPKPKLSAPGKAPVATGMQHVQNVADQYGVGSRQHLNAVRKDGMPNVTRHKNTYTGWEKYTDADGREYHLGPDPDNDGEFVVLDKDDKVIADGYDNRAEALLKIDKIARDTVKANAIGTARKQSEERAAAAPKKPEPPQGPVGTPAVAPVTNVASVPDWYGGVNTDRRATFDRAAPSRFFDQLAPHESRVRVQTQDGTIHDGIYMGGKSVGGKRKVGIRATAGAKTKWIDPMTTKLAWGDKGTQKEDIPLSDFQRGLLAKKATAPKAPAKKTVVKAPVPQKTAVRAPTKKTAAAPSDGFPVGKRVNSEFGPGTVAARGDRGAINIKLDNGESVTITAGTPGHQRFLSANSPSAPPVPQAPTTAQGWATRHARMIEQQVRPVDAFVNTQAAWDKREADLEAALKDATPEQRAALKRQLDAMKRIAMKSKEYRAIPVIDKWRSALV